jgi:hypothetical protein
MWNAEYISYKGNTNFSRAYQGEELVWEKNPYWSNEPFWIENAGSNNVEIRFDASNRSWIGYYRRWYITNIGEEVGSIYYSYDKENWIDLFASDNQYLTILPNERVWFKNESNISYEKVNTLGNVSYPLFVVNFGIINIGGNIHSFIHKWSSRNSKFSNSYALSCAFSNLPIIDASDLILPETKLTQHCYDNMFSYCSQLIYPPLLLPAKIIPSYGYKHMFAYCSSLIETSDMLATNVEMYGCEYMYINCVKIKESKPIRLTYIGLYGMHRVFYGCTSLEYPPELPATNISGQAAYYGLFHGCTSLKVAPKLNHILFYGNEAFRDMFYGCTSLEYPPELPAQHLDYLDSFCFSGMFRGCSNLKECAKLPEGNYKCRNYVFYYMYADCVNITNPCEFPSGYSIDEQNSKNVFDSMFSGCVNLQTAPDLSWVNNVGRETFKYMFKNCTSLLTPPKMPDLDFTSSDDSICREMFYGCTSLTESPILYSSLIPNNGYRQMFAYCPNLSKITCLATEFVNTYSVMGMTLNVSSTGTFYKHPDMNGWSTGISGIPSGWEVIDYTE